MSLPPIPLILFALIWLFYIVALATPDWYMETFKTGINLDEERVVYGLFKWCETDDPGQPIQICYDIVPDCTQYNDPSDENNQSPGKANCKKNQAVKAFLVWAVLMDFFAFAFMMPNDKFRGLQAKNASGWLSAFATICGIVGMGIFLGMEYPSEGETDYKGQYSYSFALCVLSWVLGLIATFLTFKAHSADGYTTVAN